MTDRFADHDTRMFILDRDDHRCRYCGAHVPGTESANIDHVVPWPDGPSEPENLVTSCRTCNRSKGRQRWEPRPLPIDREACPCGAPGGLHWLSDHHPIARDEIRRNHNR